ncbi:MAG: glycosyltransferase family 4 protein [Xenococcaceae cyanobacterium MO_207.B15]|nr:glycosyltransferase family 4 protein [Xenococcaceae cyanobacterium MO_207.B15]
MSKVLLTGSNNLITPNSPRKYRDEITHYKAYRLWYIGERILQKMWSPLQGVSLFKPLTTKFDLIHSFNVIPYTRNPWLITFESVLPRTRGKYGDKLASIIINRLSLENCRKIIAMSEHAKEKFLRQKADLKGINSIKDKLIVVPPNFPLKVSQAKKYLKGETLELTFVGNHFARKGGIVALRIAKKATAMKLPIKINLVSRMNYGAKVYTDCPDGNKYLKDLELINLENVSLYRNIANEKVINLLDRSHFQVMCTLDDTYGFSILEGFSVGTPAITTNVCALPEFVKNNINGFVIDLELNQYKHWIHLGKRHTKYYWEILDKTYENLADRVLDSIMKIIDGSENYEQLSAGAISQARIHDSEKANIFFDNLYSELSR